MTYTADNFQPAKFLTIWRLSGDGSDDIHKPMLGLIGLIIAYQSSLQRKITMQKRHLRWPPTLFFDHTVPPSIFILESPLRGDHIFRVEVFCSASCAVHVFLLFCCRAVDEVFSAAADQKPFVKKICAPGNLWNELWKWWEPTPCFSLAT